jgi:branched-chain amino acid transport system permease protein
MTFIGGVGFFWGPIVGAVTVTMLEFLLPDATDAWMLYFGLLFIFVVMFAPGGLAGWIHRHIAVARTGRLMTLAPSYALVIPAIALSFAGAVLGIELAHHFLLHHDAEGPAMSVLHVGFSDVSPAAWATAAILLLAGLGGLRFAWPRVSEAWAQALRLPQDLAPT